ncbi:MAG: hypothetical protein MK132_19430 [Lentisphaerales bacterium]|nr:hypothetical protein [Lentisphaerales bacterium]
MAHSEYLEEVLNRITNDWPVLKTKKIFGSIAYLINSNVCLGIWHDNIIVLSSKKNESELKKEDWGIDFDITGRIYERLKHDYDRGLRRSRDYRKSNFSST